MTKQVNVHLSSNWFAPGGQRWRAGDYRDFPAELLGELPSSATVNDGSGPMTAADWQEKNPKLAKRVAQPQGTTPATPLVDPGAPGGGPGSNAQNESPADGESLSPASPKSSGPETQALPGQEVKSGEMVTASGTKPADKEAEIAADKAGKDSKIKL